MNVPSLRRWSIKIGIAVLVALAAIQVLPYGHSRVNPPTVAEPQWNAVETRALAKQACFDCHSNETAWPAYARIAPASWLVYRDVLNGRSVVNFSEWNRPQKEAREAAEVLREQEMPPVMYRVMHADARLSDPDRERLARGLAATLGTSEESEEDER